MSSKLELTQVDASVLLNTQLHACTHIGTHTHTLSHPLPTLQLTWTCPAHVSRPKLTATPSSLRMDPLALQNREVT